MDPPSRTRTAGVSDEDDATGSSSDDENVADISTLSAPFSLEGRPDAASEQG
jgi:hypothetical protein